MRRLVIKGVKVRTHKKIEPKKKMKHRTPNKYVNESLGRYRIIRASKWSKGKRNLEKPMRLVVIGFKHGKGQFAEFGKYAVRWQDKMGATFGGSSYNSKEDAVAAFWHKYHEHNESYRPGNISHLPGIAR